MEVGVMFEHTDEGAEEFMGDGAEDGGFGFTVLEEALSEGAEEGVVAFGD